MADKYWSLKYSNFEALPASEQKAIRDKEYDIFEDFFTGAINAGKFIVTEMTHLEGAGLMDSLWKITAIDDKMKQGMYLPESQEGSSHIAFAMGFHPSILGMTPGKGSGGGAGSGSDARVAQNNFDAKATIFEDIIIEPIELVHDYNQWDPEITYWLDSVQVSTLDSGTPTKPTVN